MTPGIAGTMIENGQTVQGAKLLRVASMRVVNLTVTALLPAC
jgi:hypothetical protein